MSADPASPTCLSNPTDIPSPFAALSLPAVIVRLWYELLSNHSPIHPSFVYANIPAALGIVLGAAMLSTGPRYPTTSSSAPRNVLPASDVGDPHRDGLLAFQLSLLRYTL